MASLPAGRCWARRSTCPPRRGGGVASRAEAVPEDRGPTRRSPSTGSTPIGLTSRSHLMPALAMPAGHSFLATATRDCRRIAEPREIVDAARQHDVAVRVDEARHDRGSPSVDDRESRGGWTRPFGVGFGLIHTIRPCATRTLMPVSFEAPLRPAGGELAPRCSRSSTAWCRDRVDPALQRANSARQSRPAWGVAATEWAGGLARPIGRAADGGGVGRVLGQSPRATRKAATEADAVSRRKSWPVIRLWRSRSSHNGRPHYRLGD